MGARGVLAAALATLCLVATSANATPPNVPVSATIQRVERIDGVSPTFCSVSLQAQFSGRKNTLTGIISGSWSYSASTLCSIRVLRLTLNVLTLLGSGQVGPSPSTECRLCKSVEIVGGVSCSRCNGVWTIRSNHVIDMPVVVLLVTLPPGCQSTPSAIHCTEQIVRKLA